VSGAAVLGDGRVGLILEPTGLLRLHQERGGRGERPLAGAHDSRRLETGATASRRA
jgi:chemotaxis protein histidine kinase CheA